MESKIQRFFHQLYRIIKHKLRKSNLIQTSQFVTSLRSITLKKHQDFSPGIFGSIPGQADPPVNALIRIIFFFSLFLKFQWNPFKFFQHWAYLFLTKQIPIMRQQHMIFHFSAAILYSILVPTPESLLLIEGWDTPAPLCSHRNILIFRSICKISKLIYFHF